MERRSISADTALGQWRVSELVLVDNVGHRVAVTDTGAGKSDSVVGAVMVAGSSGSSPWRHSGASGSEPLHAAEGFTVLDRLVSTRWSYRQRGTGDQ